MTVRPNFLRFFYHGFISQAILPLFTTLFLLLYSFHAWGNCPPGLIIGKADDSSLSIKITLTDYQIIRKKGGDTRIRVDGFGLLNSSGDPMLPRAVYTLALPPDVKIESLRLTVQHVEFKTLDDSYIIEPAPPLATSPAGKQLISWGDGKDIYKGRNRLVYNSTNPYPAKTVKIISVTRLKKWQLLRLAYHPFRYYPKNKMIEVAKEVQVTIQFSGTGEKGPIYRETRVEHSARSMIKNIIQAKEWYPNFPILANGEVQSDYVIITTRAVRDNSDKIHDFKALKESFGHSVLIVTEDDYGTLSGQPPNGTAEKIREWLINNYQSRGIVFVLLVGDPHPDSGDIPMKMCWPRKHESEHKAAPSDYFYADLTGNWDLDGDGFFGEYQGDRGWGGVDFDAEVWVGRIPVYDNHYGNLDTIFQKIIAYQAESGDLFWRKKALLPMAISNYAGEPESQYPDGNYPLTDGANLGESMISGYLEGNDFYSYSLYEKSGDVPSIYACSAPLTRDNVKAEWTGGYGLVCWWGHGNEGAAYRKYWTGTTKHYVSFLRSSDASTLNDGMPSLVYQCSCRNGYPESSNNLGYALLKNGAIGTVSASRVSWYIVGWEEPGTYLGDNASLGYHYMEKLVQDNPAGKALALTKGELAMGSASIWMNLMGFNLYGDPSLALSNPASICSVDFDEDYDVDGSDLADFVANFNEDCLLDFAAAFAN